MRTKVGTPDSNQTRRDLHATGPMHRPATDRDTGAGGDRPDQGATKMSPTIRSLMIPVSDLEAAKALYTALLGSPHTDESYYVGYNVDGFEVDLNPAGAGGGRWPLRMSRTLTRRATPCLRPASPGVTRRVRPHPVRGYACSQMPTKSGRPAREVENRRRGRRCPPGELPPVAAPYRPRWRSPTCRCS